MAVICIQQKGMDSYYNLAIEEYLLKNFKEDVFMLWQSERAVVVGKHQNALAEINHRYVSENKINIARRLSGGGTVFHDPGNINFTFIKNVERIDEVNFKSFTNPIIEVLKNLGLDAYTSGRNDLLLNEKKVSGNAEHIYRKRVLHHGTLLFNSRLKALSSALKVDLSRFEDRAVQSNRSEVGNISDFLSREMSVHDFSNFLFDGIKSSYAEATIFQFSDDDKEAIQKLRDEKYVSWDWIYGYSPKYKYHNQLKVGEGIVSFSLHVKKGKIVLCEWQGDISISQSDILSEQLLNARHDYNELKSRLKKIEADIAPISIDMLLEVLI